jgi:hypothetical protein
MELSHVVKQVEHAFEPAIKLLRPILSSPMILGAWGVVLLVCIGILWWDIRKRNRALPSLMKFVWTLVVLY